MADVLLKDMSKYFGDHKIIDRINLHINSGEFVTYSDYVRSDSVIWATDLILGPDGYDIPNILNPENWNSLWLQFIAPTYSDIYYPDTAEIRLNIVAREHVP